MANQIHLSQGILYFQKENSVPPRSPKEVFNPHGLIGGLGCTIMNREIWPFVICVNKQLKKISCNRHPILMMHSFKEVFQIGRQL